MNVHYFQRYHGKENMATANTLLLLSRLYTHSPDKFFRFLQEIGCIADEKRLKIQFWNQERDFKSTPDATIKQESFKIVVETKLSVKGKFDIAQLKNHLDAFDNEMCKCLLTVAPAHMSEKERGEFEAILQLKNEENRKNGNTAIQHINTTFEEIAANIQAVLDVRDYDMEDILKDYRDYCYHDKLILDDWKWMRVQLAGRTLEVNKQLKLYYDNMDRGFRGHTYLGLYKDKSVQAIGKISAIISVDTVGGKRQYQAEKGVRNEEISDEMKERIEIAIEDSKKQGWDGGIHTRYFFVDEFYETEFTKSTPYPPRGSRVFDLTKVLNLEGVKKLPDTKEIADLLRGKTWEND